jgi:hypothetical protein
VVRSFSFVCGFPILEYYESLWIVYVSCSKSIDDHIINAGGLQAASRHVPLGGWQNCKPWSLSKCEGKDTLLFMYK